MSYPSEMMRKYRLPRAGWPARSGGLLRALRRVAGRAWLAVAVLPALLALLPAALAVDGAVTPGSPWPARPVRLVVPFPAGSTPDLFARILAEHLRAATHPVWIVENRPGAGGMIGTDAVAKSPADGYTLGVSITGPLVNNTLLYRRMAYDPFRDLAPVTLAVNQPCVLVAGAGLPAQSLDALLAALRRAPGRFNYASLGNGTMAHLAMALIAARSGVQLVQVAYPGSGQAVAALIAGDAQLACLPPAAVMPQIGAGKLQALGIAAARRSSLMPGLPTLSEQGLAGVEANAWIGVVAPAGIAPALLAKIHEAIVESLHDPSVVAALERQYMEPAGGSAEAFARYMQEELQRWGPIIRANQIHLD